MNEQIAKLAEQASLELFNDTAHHRLLKGFAEKFAELIVRECMGVNSTLLGHNTCKNLHNLYEEHFGVEE